MCLGSTGAGSPAARKEKQRTHLRLTCLAHAAAAQHHQLDDFVGSAIQRGVLRDGQQQEVGGVLRHGELRDDEEHARRDGSSSPPGGGKRLPGRLSAEGEALSSHWRRFSEECEMARPPPARA